jgi:hypothetical protein
MKQDLKEFCEVTGFSEDCEQTIIWSAVVVLGIMFIGLMNKFADFISGINFLNLM